MALGGSNILAFRTSIAASIAASPDLVVKVILSHNLFYMHSFGGKSENYTNSLAADFTEAL